jgi:hypothetical protein
VFSAASDIAHAAAGVLSSAMHAGDGNRSLVTRRSAARYALTDQGRAVLRAMLPGS